jgi:hypothetical protein
MSEGNNPWALGDFLPQYLIQLDKRIVTGDGDRQQCVILLTIRFVGTPMKVNRSGYFFDVQSIPSSRLEELSPLVTQSPGSKRYPTQGSVMM